MSTKQTTTSTTQFDPTSMGVYKGFQPTIASTLADYAKNPLLATFFQNQLQMANRANQAMGNAATQQYMWNSRALGPVADRSAVMASNLSRIQRSNLSRQSQTFNNLLLNAENVRRGAIQQMQGYNPLQTGQTTTQQQSGLGTWLPQLAGMGISAFTGGMGKGLTSAFNPLIRNVGGATANKAIASMPLSGGQMNFLNTNPNPFLGGNQ